MTDIEILQFIRGRLINVHGEDPGLDFIRRLDRVIEDLGRRRDLLMLNDVVEKMASITTRMETFLKMLETK